MEVKLIALEENEDGSLNVEVDMDEEAKEYFAKEGLIYTIMKRLEEKNGKVE